MTAKTTMMSRAGRFLDGPIIATGAMVLIVISMVIPMSPRVLDLGIALSIACAMLVLVMASLVDKPTDFQAFPVLLLISLVIRLALNVSSTRLILTQGHTGTDAAGHVINGFAAFVAGDSLLVGLTIFAVISVVNFMVITKGSTRMAEVSARFALDSLPGKQLAIDGDLNSGAIDHAEAGRRRAAEQGEISFYGSLDGASKFVKGDAIASIVITMINLMVGLGTGIAVHGMSAGDAVATYSHLTIGDGLVTQVPALITSMAAALLLSRGGASDPTATLLSSQFLRSWKPAAVVGGAMVVLSLIPGMPKLLFLTIAAACAAAAWHLTQRRDEQQADPQPAETAPSAVENRIGDVLDTDEISIEIGTDLVSVALDPARGLGTRINNLRIHIVRYFGLILPDVRITDTELLHPGDYVIRIQGVTRGRGTLRPHEALALGPDHILEQLKGAPVREPVYSSPAKWIPRNDQDEAATIGATVVTPMEVLSTHLMEIVKANLPQLLTLSAMQRQIDELKSISAPARAERYRRYFESMIPEKVSPETLLGVLRALLDEKVSIRNLPLIVDAIAEFRTVDSPDALYELVRKRLRGQISQQYTSDAGQLSAIQLHPAWEAEFVRADTETGRGNTGAITPSLSGKLLERTRDALTLAGAADSPVIIAPDHRRRLIRAILGSNSIATPVLGFEEVDPQIDIRFVATIEAP